VEPSASTVTLGVDYGVKQVGLACMAGWAPRALPALVNAGSSVAVARRVALVARAERARAVVVGLALERDGRERTQARVTRAFAAGLATVLAEEANNPGQGGRRVPSPVLLVRCGAEGGLCA